MAGKQIAIVLEEVRKNPKTFLLFKKREGIIVTPINPLATQVSRLVCSKDTAEASMKFHHSSVRSLPPQNACVEGCVANLFFYQRRHDGG